MRMIKKLQKVAKNCLYGVICIIGHNATTKGGRAETMKQQQNAASRRDMAQRELEKVREKYREYMEQLQFMPQPDDPEPQYAPPSPENPLTDNRIRF